jgi:hypothetical protein
MNSPIDPWMSVYGLESSRLRTSGTTYSPKRKVFSRTPELCSNVHPVFLQYFHLLAHYLSSSSLFGFTDGFFVQYQTRIRVFEHPLAFNVRLAGAPTLAPSQTLLSYANMTGFMSFAVVSFTSLVCEGKSICIFNAFTL